MCPPCITAIATTVVKLGSMATVTTVGAVGMRTLIGTVRGRVGERLPPVRSHDDGAGGPGVSGRLEVAAEFDEREGSSS